MYVALAIIITAVISVVIGHSVEQAYGQVNVTGENMTDTNMTIASSNLTATDMSTTNGVPTADVLTQKLNAALADVLGKVRQEDPEADISKVECTIDPSWNVQCTADWRAAKGGQVSATKLNSSKSNAY
jgi:hypothetical protein